VRTQLLALLKPFSPRLISPPAEGKFGSYVSHYVIEQRLLSAVGPYSWRITQTILDRDGTLTGCIGELVVEVDGRKVSCSGAGDVENPSNSKTNGERLKFAESDAFKRAAMRLGVGLHLWAQDDFYVYDLLSKAEVPVSNKSPGEDQDGTEEAGGSGLPPALTPEQIESLAPK
jgi:hypothetical protein